MLLIYCRSHETLARCGELVALEVRGIYDKSLLGRCEDGEWTFTGYWTSTRRKKVKISASQITGLS
jgi:hypothetical protein